MPRATRAVVVSLALLGAACTDRQPLAPSPPPPPALGAAGTPVTLSSLDCTADVRGGTLTCTTARPDSSPADIVIGGQDTYVTMGASALAYNPGTGVASAQVTLQNLIPQPIGTGDGVTADPSGIRVFFHEGPNGTGGSVSVRNQDGFATFTAVNQPFFRYVERLAQNATSGTKTWEWNVPPSVTVFTFKLYVSAPVQYPDGYVDVSPATYTVHPGEPLALTAVVRTAVGNAVPGAPVTWGSSDTDAATIDAGGNVTAIRAAAVTMTATSGVRTGSAALTVSGTVRTWAGAVSADFSVAGNWVGGVLPAGVDSVVIPTGTPNAPALTAATAIGGVTVADGATLSLGAFDLTAGANVGTGPTAGSGILGTTGRLVLAGTGLVHGRVPRMLATGIYALDGNLYLVAPETIDAGRLTVDRYEMQVVSQ